MPVGLQVFNDSGITQIDDTGSVNLSLRTKGYLQLTTLGYSSFYRYADIAIPSASTPFVALRSESHWKLEAWGVAGYYTSGGTTYIRCAAAATLGTVNHIWRLKYWVFDKPLVSANGAGLEVYSSGGLLKYSSLVRSVPIAGSGEGTYPSGTGQPYAIVNPCSLDINTIDDDSAQSTVRVHNFTGYRVVGTTVTQNTVIVEDENLGYQYPYPQHPKFGMGSNTMYDNNSVVVLNMSGWGLVGDADAI
jgi:hypothetical protein